MGCLYIVETGAKQNESVAMLLKGQEVKSGTSNGEVNKYWVKFGYRSKTMIGADRNYSETEKGVSQ